MPFGIRYKVTFGRIGIENILENGSTRKYLINCMKSWGKWFSFWVIIVSKIKEYMEFIIFLPCFSLWDV